MRPVLLHVLVLSLVVLAVYSISAQSDNGFVGIYSDMAGTTPCVSVPPFTGDTLYILARTAGKATFGIRGAEFRIEATDTSGWCALTFHPTATATLALGNPIDADSDPNAGGGVSLSFGTCQGSDAN